VIVVLTAALVGATVWYAVTTSKALGRARDANDLTRQAIEAAHQANQAAEEANRIATRGYFGAELVILRPPGSTVRFLVCNIGTGIARGIHADWDIGSGSPTVWKPAADPPQWLPDLPGRGLEGAEHYLGVRPNIREQDFAPPPNYRWATPDEAKTGAVTKGRLGLRYSDAFSEELEIFSEPLALIHLDPPNLAV
jgi:hypothetical protein